MTTWECLEDVLRAVAKKRGPNTLVTYADLIQVVQITNNTLERENASVEREEALQELRSENW